IGARLVHLQTSQHERLLARARLQQQARQEENAARGRILDREGRELACTVEVESFFAAPGEIEDPAEVSKLLAPLVGTERTKLAERLREAKQAGRQFVWLARKLDPQHGAAIRALGIKGVHTVEEPQRRYPSKALAAHVVGFVGLDDEGLGGVEQFHNASLEGEAGNVVVDRDARRRSYESVEINPRAGQSVVLTIDQSIQYHAERALASALERTRAKSATAIVLEPHTGEILALANAPTFDPNEAGKATAQARRNEALQNIYEPGSTFKIVAFSAALEEKLARPEDRIDCQMGSINVAGRTVRDHTAFGTLTLTEALAKSSNVAAIKLGLRVGDRRMHEYITRFGFGSRTGVELPGETAGLLRPVARWQASSMGSIAIGQEIGVTPLQVASAFAALANDGVRVQPHLVKELRDADGALVTQTKPEERRVLSAETARVVRNMLESVTVKGTAKAAQLEGYTAAGKTGTAQKIDPKTRTYSKTKHVASFVGFAPVERPAVVIIVVVDEPAGAYHGGDVAAPIFREIAEQVLPYMNVLPDVEIKPEEATANEPLVARASSPNSQNAQQEQGANAQGETRGAAAATPEHLPEVAAREAGGAEIVYAEAGQRALLMPNLRGVSVRDAARICAQLGLELEARGEGRALKQSPAAGESVEAGQTVRVEFGRSD
ncbi:MAG TPA: penicillin-binding protein, partial [Pyrinomonadaceae bacterium]